MSEWKKVRLGDVVSLVIDHRGKTPKKLGGDWAESGYRALSAKTVKTRQIVNEDSIRFVGETMYREWMKDEIQRGDILVTSEAPYGEVYYWDSDEKIVLSQRLFGLRIKPEYDSAYVAQYMTTTSFKQEMDARATGTTVFGLRQPELLECKLMLPPLPTQRKIAAVLGALDDKIENNRKICANLEAQAQAIFKLWFVDFEPFGGKMPQGWKMGKLGELIEVCYGKDHKALPEGDIPVFGSGGYMRSVDRCIYDEESVLIPRKGTLNNIMYVNEPFWTVDTMFYSKMREEHVAKYVHLLLQGKNMDEFNVGSAVPSMTTEILNNMEIIIPLPKTLKEFDGIASSFYAEVAHAKKESRALAAMRDALLPKLMSGEIDVERVEVA